MVRRQAPGQAEVWWSVYTSKYCTLNSSSSSIQHARGVKPGGDAIAALVELTVADLDVLDLALGVAALGREVDRRGLGLGI